MKEEIKHCKDCYYFLQHEDLEYGKCIPFDKDWYGSNTICDEFKEELENERGNFKGDCLF